MKVTRDAITLRLNAKERERLLIALRLAEHTLDEAVRRELIPPLLIECGLEPSGRNALLGLQGFTRELVRRL